MMSNVKEQKVAINEGEWFFNEEQDACTDYKKLTMKFSNNNNAYIIRCILTENKGNESLALFNNMHLCEYKIK